MKLGDATLLFIDSAKPKNSVQPTDRSVSHKPALMLLSQFFSPDAELAEITPSRLRDFLSRWYLEEACASKINDSKSGQHAMESPSSRGGQALDVDSAGQIPNPHDLLNSLSAFFTWAGRQPGADQPSEHATILIELQDSLSRAIEISNALSSSIQKRGGAFNFPEFLTSFEEGGSSQYDIDVPGNVGAIDGYFRIVRVDGSSVEAEELISEQRISSILFPSDVAAVLGEEYILSLELVRTADGWQIAGCGFAYPPGTEI